MTESGENNGSGFFLGRDDEEFDLLSVIRRSMAPSMSMVSVGLKMSGVGVSNVEPASESGPGKGIYSGSVLGSA